MKTRTGLTLIELLVAISLAAILLTAVSSFFWRSVKSWEIIAVKYGRQQASRPCLARIERDIRSASQVITSSTTEEVSLISGGEVISYRLIEQKLRRKKGASSAYLSSEGEIGDLVFSYPSAGSVIIHSGKRVIYVSTRN